MLALTLSGCGEWRDHPPVATQAQAANGGDEKSVATTTAGTTSATTEVPSAGGDAATPSPAVTAQDSSASTGPTPSEPPAPAQPAAQSGAINSVDVMIDDMRLMNDLPLKNVNPAYGWAHGPGFVMMGNDPRGTNTPDWWKASNPGLVNDNYLPRMLPWAVMFEGVGNAASNTRVQVRNLRAYVLSKSTGQWQLTHSADSMDGTDCPQTGNYFECTTSMDTRPESSGGSSIKPRPGMNAHGWFGGRALINGPDIAAVFVTMESRLVVDNPQGPDDRNAAKFLFHVGADYYHADHVTVLMPAVAISRSKQISNEWQAFNMTTFSDVGLQEPGGGITQAQLRANPPPIN
ncbi:MAG: hypothetical protein R3E68_19785 [Burkholderiaceae bacterium]